MYNKGWRSLFLMLDTISEGPGLTINGRKRFESKTGAALCLLGHLSVFMVVLLQLNQFFHWRVMGVTETGLYQKQVPTIDLKKGRLLPLIRWKFKDTVVERPHDLYLIEMSFWMWARRPNSNYEEMPLRVTTKMAQCNELPSDVVHKFYKLDDDDEVLDSYWGGLLCFNATDFHSNIARARANLSNHGWELVPLTEKNLSTTSLSQSVQLNVYPCDPHMSEFCRDMTEEQRRTLMKNARLDLYMIGRHQDFENSARPFSYENLEQKMIINPRLNEGKSVIINLGRTFIQDNYGLPFKMSTNKNLDWISDIEKSSVGYGEEQIPLKCTKYDRRNDTCHMYASISMRYHTSQEVRIVHRRFKSLADTLATIGGIRTVIWIGIGLFYQWVLARFANLNMKLLVEQIFGIRLPYIRWCKTKVIKKKTPKETQEEQEKVNRAYEFASSTVEDYLDVRFLVKQLMNLRVLVNCLMCNKSQSISPVIAFNLKEAKVGRKESIGRNTSLLEYKDVKNFIKANSIAVLEEDLFEDRTPPPYGGLNTRLLKPDETESIPRNGPQLFDQAEDTSQDDIQLKIRRALVEHQRGFMVNNKSFLKLKNYSSNSGADLKDLDDSADIFDPHTMTKDPML